MNSDRNPINPCALRLRDMSPGRHIIRVNTGEGLIDEYIVVERPRVYGTGALSSDRYLEAKLRSVETGEVTYKSMEDMGVIPYPGGDWNTVNFMIDHRQRNHPSLTRLR